MIDGVEMVLYIDGAAAASRAAEKNLEDLCRAHLLDYRIEIIDVSANPMAAVEEQLVALPTLTISRDGRKQRIIGDMTVAGPVITAIGMGQNARRMRAEAQVFMARVKETSERNRDRMGATPSGSEYRPRLPDNSDWDPDS